jgi:hypothetical protein
MFMTEFAVFLYAFLTFFVITCMQRHQREQRPTPQMMTMVGWGLFSLSSTLAVLLTGLALALAIGVKVPVAGLTPGSLF